MANIIRRRQETANVWDPFRIMLEMLGEPTSGVGSLGYAAQAAFTPAFEVFERKDAYVFKGDLPGVKQEDLEISLTENRLTISGKRDSEERKEGERYYAVERVYGQFTRTFSLPEGVDGEHVKAELKDGVLTLIVPKKPEVQPRRIQIGLGGGQKQ
jgi:HSP20 family protein